MSVALGVLNGTYPPKEEEEETVAMSYKDAVSYFEKNGFDEPDPADYGVWVPGCS